jgi:hypothetical protein
MLPMAARLKAEAVSALTNVICASYVSSGGAAQEISLELGGVIGLYRSDFNRRNRRVQPTECAMRAISKRAETPKPDRPITAVVPGTLLPRTIEGRFCS